MLHVGYLPTRGSEGWRNRMTASCSLAVPGDLIARSDSTSITTWRVGGRPILPSDTFLEEDQLTCGLCRAALSLVFQVGAVKLAGICLLCPMRLQVFVVYVAGWAQTLTKYWVLQCGLAGAWLHSAWVRQVTKELASFSPPRERLASSRQFGPMGSRETVEKELG